jgi:signal transduction histidine kinase
VQARLVEDLLDVSRAITGKLRIRPKVVSLKALLRDTLEVVGPSILAKKLTLHDDSGDEPCVVFGDPQRLTQVLWNIFSNAIKFTPSGGRVPRAVESPMPDEAPVTTTIAPCTFMIFPFREWVR